MKCVIIFNMIFKTCNNNNNEYNFKPNLIKIQQEIYIIGGAIW